METQEHLHGQR